jgi:hypothetical protein
MLGEYAAIAVEPLKLGRVRDPLSASPFLGVSTASGIALSPFIDERP